MNSRFILYQILILFISMTALGQSSSLFAPKKNLRSSDYHRLEYDGYYNDMSSTSFVFNPPDALPDMKDYIKKGNLSISHYFYKVEIPPHDNGFGLPNDEVIKILDFYKNTKYYLSLDYTFSKILEPSFIGCNDVFKSYMVDKTPKSQYLYIQLVSSKTSPLMVFIELQGRSEISFYDELIGKYVRFDKYSLTLLQHTNDNNQDVWFKLLCPLTIKNYNMIRLEIDNNTNIDECGILNSKRASVLYEKNRSYYYLTGQVKDSRFVGDVRHERLDDSKRTLIQTLKFDEYGFTK